MLAAAGALIQKEVRTLPAAPRAELTLAVVLCLSQEGTETELEVRIFGELPANRAVSLVCVDFWSAHLLLVPVSSFSFLLPGSDFKLYPVLSFF